MNEPEAKFEDLLSDAGAFEESAVVGVLEPLITIKTDTHEIHFKNSNLKVKLKILAFGLAKKLLRVKGKIESDEMTASEIHKKYGIKKGSVDSAFKSLREEQLIIGHKGKYEIPTYKVIEIIEILEKDQKG